MGLTSQCLILATTLLFSVSSYILQVSSTTEFDPVNKTNASLNVNELARFAVQRYNQQEHKQLQFRDVEHANFKRVRGNTGVYAYLIIKAKDGGATNLYKATVLQRPPHKSLLSFARVQG